MHGTGEVIFTDTFRHLTRVSFLTPSRRAVARYGRGDFYRYFLSLDEGIIFDTARGGLLHGTGEVIFTDTFRHLARVSFLTLLDTGKAFFCRHVTRVSF